MDTPESVHALDSSIEKNLDGYIERWGADLRSQWGAEGRFDAIPKVAQMHRTALITICRVREARVEAQKAQIENAQFNAAPRQAH